MAAAALRLETKSRRPQAALHRYARRILT